MASMLYPFVALLLSLSVLLTGTGLLGSLLALRMEVEAFPTATIGTVMACYSVGYVLASIYFGRVIARVGHIRSFAVLAALAAGSTLLYPLFIAAPLWALCRTVFGFCVAGLYMVTESWLNHRTPREFRGRVLAFYSIATYAALGGGQFLLNLWEVRGFELFSLAALLLALALVPISLTRAPTPELTAARPVGLRRLYQISPLGLVGSLLAGIASGAFLALGPVFGRQVGLAVSEVSILMGAALLGGLLLQWPVGRLSDRFNRRLVIVWVAVGVALVSVSAALAAGRSEWAVIAAALLWGGLVFTLYPLCLALANDFIPPEELVGTGAALLLVHGVGMIIGPVVMARAMALAGPGALFFGIAAVMAVLAVYGLWRQRVGEAVVVEEQAHYRVVADTTPLLATLDPRGEEPQLEFDFSADPGAVETDVVNSPDAKPD